MPTKKLPFYQINRIEEHHAKDQTLIRLQPVPLDQVRDPKNAPDGAFTFWAGHIVLPKRKRGVKFRITYTEIFQKEL